MRSRNLEWCIIIPMLISSCITLPGMPNQTHYPKTMTPIVATPTRSAINSLNPSTTSTLIVSSLPSATSMISKTQASTSTPETATNIQKNCLDFLPAIPENRSYRGKIILIGKLVFQLGKGNVYFDKVSFFDLMTKQAYLLAPYKVLNIAISPNRKKYALDDMTDHQIKIFSAEGLLLYTLAKGSNPWYLGEWLDDDHIVLVISQPIEGTPYDIYPQDNIVINLITGEQELIPSSYPDIDLANARMRWEGGGTTKYDPTLTRVVYASLIEKDYLGNQGQGYVLWDMVNKRKLVEIASHDFGMTPKWSPDGSKFVLNGLNGDFFIVTRDGKVNQITYLDPNSQSMMRKIFYFSGRYSWSPNSRHLALWLETVDMNNDSRYGTFVVLDTETGEMIDYCVSAGFIEKGVPMLPGQYLPVWSPDGKFVVIKANNQEEGNSEVLVVDFEGGFAAKIGENLTPIGWLDTP